MTARAYVAIGSNIERERRVPAAVERLAGTYRGVRASTFYQTPAVGSPGAPDFWNGMIELLEPPPLAILRDELRQIESALGRRRVADKNAPRTIDLDVAAYVDDAGIVQHLDDDVGRYAFVREPLRELAPGLALPRLSATSAAPLPLSPLPAVTEALRALCSPREPSR